MQSQKQGTIPIEGQVALGLLFLMLNLVTMYTLSKQCANWPISRLRCIAIKAQEPLSSFLDDTGFYKVHTSSYNHPEAFTLPPSSLPCLLLKWLKFLKSAVYSGRRSRVIGSVCATFWQAKCDYCSTWNSSWSVVLTIGYHRYQVHRLDYSTPPRYLIDHQIAD